MDVAPAEIPPHERQTATGWVNWQLLVSRDVKVGGEGDVVSAVRSEWVALLSPEQQAEQAVECPLLPLFGRSVVHRAFPPCSPRPLPLFFADFRSLLGERSRVMPTAPHRNGLPVWSSGAACAPNFWAWLESEMGLNEGDVPREWTAAEPVPTAKVPFWPAGISSLL